MVRFNQADALAAKEADDLAVQAAAESAALDALCEQAVADSKILHQVTTKPR